MSGTTDLYEIIQAMSRSEKRYFKLFSDFQGGNKDYTALFNAIIKQKKYNEEDARIKLGLSQRQFILVKNYLYKQILKCLNTFHTSNTRQKDISNQIDSAEILFYKGLHKQSMKILKRNKKKAVEYEYWIEVLKINQIENQIYLANNDFEELTTNLDQRDEVVKNMGNEFHFTSIFNKSLGMHYDRYIDRSQDNSNETATIISDNNLDDIAYCKTVLSKIAFHQTHEVFHLMNAEPDKWYERNQKILKLFEENPGFKQAHANSYFIILTNAMHASMESHHSEEALHYAKLIRKSDMSNISPVRNVYAHLSCTLTELIVNIRMGDKKEVSKLLKYLNDNSELDFHLIGKGSLMALKYQMAHANFLLKNYKESHQLFNDILNQPTKNTRKDLLGFSRIMMLIITYHTGKTELIDYQIRSTYRYLINNEHLFKAEKIFLKFIIKIPDINTKKEYTTLFSKTKKEFEKLTQNYLERRAFSYFDFIAWIESQMAGKDMLQSLKDRYLNQSKS